MVVYDLICKKKHSFEGWFPSFESYQEQARKGQITCPTCGSSKVEKVPHACAVISQRGDKENPKPVQKKPEPPLTETEATELLFKLHHYVKENFEDVGARFAREAKEIFHGEAEPRPIHGTATSEEQRELDEEGIPFYTLPKPKLDGQTERRTLVSRLKLCGKAGPDAHAPLTPSTSFALQSTDVLTGPGLVPVRCGSSPGTG